MLDQRRSGAARFVAESAWMPLDLEVTSDVVGINIAFLKRSVVAVEDGAFVTTVLFAESEHQGHVTRLSGDMSGYDVQLSFLRFTQVQDLVTSQRSQAVKCLVARLDFASVAIAKSWHVPIFGEQRDNRFSETARRAGVWPGLGGVELALYPSVMEPLRDMAGLHARREREGRCA